MFSYHRHEKSSAISSILIVSREPAAESAASKFGAEIIRDDHESGVNDAVALALKTPCSRRL